MGVCGVEHTVKDKKKIQNWNSVRAMCQSSKFKDRIHTKKQQMAQSQDGESVESI